MQETHEQAMLHKLDTLYLEAAASGMPTVVGSISDATYALSENMFDLGQDIPEAPEGYERCAECGVPVKLGGNGVCAQHGGTL